MSTEALSFALRDGMQRNGLEASGMALQLGADGHLRASVERLRIQHVRLQTGLGAIGVSSATLTGAVIRMTAPPSHPSFEVLGLQAEEVHLEGVELALQPAHRDGQAATHRWRLDAIGRLQGELRAFITDAVWVVDAEVALPIANGRIDFNRVAVEHFGPDSSMGISRNSIHIDAPNMGRIDLFAFTAPSIPGARYEQRGGFASRVSDRGSLDLQAFVEALLGAAGKEPLGKTAGRDVEVMLDRTRLSGELRLGEGAMGTERHHVVLAGQATGKNRMGLSSDVLGHRLVLRMPEMSASQAVFELLGKAGTSGPIAARLEVHATGLSHLLSGSTAPFELVVAVDDMTLRQVAVGSVDAPATAA